MGALPRHPDYPLPQLLLLLGTFFTTLVSTHGLPNEIYLSVFISVLQAKFNSAINLDVFLLFRFFDNCPD